MIILIGNDWKNNIDYIIENYYKEKEEIIKKPFSLRWLINWCSNETKPENIKLIQDHFFEKKIEPLIKKLFKDTYNLLIKIKNWMNENERTCFKNQEEFLDYHLKALDSNSTFEVFEKNIKILSMIEFYESLINDNLPNRFRNFYNDLIHDTYEIIGTLNHIISWENGSIAMHNENRKEIHDEILSLYEKGKFS